MSERKSAGNRGSLMDLARPRLTHTPLTAPIDEAERKILAADTMPFALPQSGAQPALTPVAIIETVTEPQSAPHQAEASDDILSRLRKEHRPIAVVGFKFPATLKDELQAVAQFNNTDMTRIVIAALERLLPDLPHPPGWLGQKH